MSLLLLPLPVCVLLLWFFTCVFTYTYYSVHVSIYPNMTYATVDTVSARAFFDFSVFLAVQDFKNMQHIKYWSAHNTHAHTRALGSLHSNLFTHISSITSLLITSVTTNQQLWKCDFGRPSLQVHTWVCPLVLPLISRSFVAQDRQMGVSENTSGLLG